jgi:hypothetical protein
VYLVLGEAPTDGTSLLGAEVEREQLLFLYASRSVAFCFCEIMVCTSAMEVAPPCCESRSHTSTPLSFSSSRTWEIGKQKRKKRKRAIKHTHLGELAGGTLVTLAMQRRESSGTLIQAAMGTTKGHILMGTHKGKSDREHASRKATASEAKGAYSSRAARHIIFAF